MELYYQISIILGMILLGAGLVTVLWAGYAFFRAMLGRLPGEDEDQG